MDLRHVPFKFERFDAAAQGRRSAEMFAAGNALVRGEGAVPTIPQGLGVRARMDAVEISTGIFYRK